MKVTDSISGTTAKSGMKVEKMVNALRIKAVCTSTATCGEAETIIIKKIMNNGHTVIVCPEMKLKAFGGITAEGPFVNKKTVNSDGDTVAFTRHVELAQFGVKLGMDENIEVELKNLTGANCTYDVYGLENPMPENKIVQINVQQVATGQKNKTIGLAGIETIAIETANLTEVNIAYENGKTVTLKGDEITDKVLESFENTELVYKSGLPTGTYYTAVDTSLLIINTMLAKEISISTDGTATQVYLVDTIEG